MFFSAERIIPSGRERSRRWNSKSPRKWSESKAIICLSRRNTSSRAYALSLRTVVAVVLGGCGLNRFCCGSFCLCCGSLFLFFHSQRVMVVVFFFIAVVVFLLFPSVVLVVLVTAVSLSNLEKKEKTF